mmetsp:Transcript_124956/g.233693  ORF Transcript_124956/g.233693 Transcript_124956/m.233693 type:complete len:296 (+) Transcript_124956:994-1881(+)
MAEQERVLNRHLLASGFVPFSRTSKRRLVICFKISLAIQGFRCSAGADARLPEAAATGVFKFRCNTEVLSQRKLLGRFFCLLRRFAGCFHPAPKPTHSLIEVTLLAAFFIGRATILFGGLTLLLALEDRCAHSAHHRSSLSLRGSSQHQQGRLPKGHELGKRCPARRRDAFQALDNFVDAYDPCIHGVIVVGCKIVQALPIRPTRGLGINDKAIRLFSNMFCRISRSIDLSELGGLSILVQLELKLLLASLLRLLTFVHDQAVLFEDNPSPIPLHVDCWPPLLEPASFVTGMRFP